MYSYTTYLLVNVDFPQIAIPLLPHSVRLAVRHLIMPEIFQGKVPAVFVHGYIFDPIRFEPLRCRSGKVAAGRAFCERDSPCIETLLQKFAASCSPSVQLVSDS